jgi:predicted permease
VAISLAAGLLLGLLPVARLPGLTVGRELVSGGRGATAGRERSRARSALVVSQVAAALVLLTGSGLMIRSLLALRQVEPGFVDPQQVLTLRLVVPDGEVRDPERVAAIYEQVLQKLQAMPMVDRAGASSSIAMDGQEISNPLMVEGMADQADQMPPLRRYKWVSPGYFETLGNPLLAGRGFTWADLHDRAPLAVVSRRLALAHWNTVEAALGQRVRFSAEDPWRTIVGVVGDVHDDGVDRAPPAIVFWPMVQEDFWGEDLAVRRSMSFAVRTSRVGSPGLLDEVQQAVWSVNPNLPVTNVQSLDSLLQRSMARTSFTLTLLTIAAAMALLLGTLGLYGVTSYSVARRTQEIAVRIALGAGQGVVRRMILVRSLALAALGLVLGLGGAIALTRLMSALLFGVESADPLTFAGACLVLIFITGMASYASARRASAIKPSDALRSE